MFLKTKTGTRLRSIFLLEEVIHNGSMNASVYFQSLRRVLLLKILTPSSKSQRGDDRGCKKTRR